MDAWTKAIQSKNELAILQAGFAFGEAIDGLRDSIEEHRDQARQEAQAKLGPGEPELQASVTTFETYRLAGPSDLAAAEPGQLDPGTTPSGPFSGDGASDRAGAEQGQSTARDAAVGAGIGLGVGAMRDAKLPPGVAPVNMNDRHVLDNLDFFKAVKSGPGSGNSYLESPISDEALAKLYVEAANRAVKDGVKTSNFRLSNGQTWSVNTTTGKFFPVEGPGIIQLTQQEVRLLEQFVTRVSAVGGEAAVQNVSRAFAGQNYSITPNMERALHIVAGKLGVADELLAPLASGAPSAAVEATLLDAARLKAAGRAFKIVKWGGRIMLVVAIAADAYEIYEADFNPKLITKKAGAWAGSLAAGGLAAEAASPLLVAGPWGWVGYGVIVGGAGIVGYFGGGELTETIYEWGFEKKK
jgi:hypothetical protein